MGATFWLTVTDGPVAWPPGELARLHPASRVATAATPIRPTQGMSLLIACSFPRPAGYRRRTSGAWKKERRQGRT